MGEPITCASCILYSNVGLQFEELMQTAAIVVMIACSGLAKALLEEHQRELPAQVERLR